MFAIAPEEFSHGGTRNLLAARAAGAHVAFLTQDAVPASPTWLAALLAPFAEHADLGLACGPYRPRADASVSVRRELDGWFSSLSPDGAVRVDRLAEGERSAPGAALFGPRTFFTDANACIARAALDEVPFRPVAYAEDQQLALDMLRAGYAKAYVPAAAVVHSHEYTSAQLLRRSFDEWRGLRDVYGYVEPLSVAALRRNVVGPVRAGGSVRHAALRYGGAVLGSRAQRLPQAVRRRLSLEGRP